MFKKLIALLLCLFLLLSPSVLADTIDVQNLSDIEALELLSSLINRVSDNDLNGILFERLGNYDNNALTALSDLIASELKERDVFVPTATLEFGSKGEDVKTLQLRLIELNYLSGSADGDFGNKTVKAVKLFQQEVGLTQTGIADSETQIALFAEDAPEATVYLEMDFNAISRDPDTYTGKNYMFSGKVLQVMEESTSYGTYVAMRIATKGNYDNVVYITYIRENGEKRILEDDRVTIYGICEGLYSYEAVSGAEITLPAFYAETINLDS